MWTPVFAALLMVTPAQAQAAAPSTTATAPTAAPADNGTADGPSARAVVVPVAQSAGAVAMAGAAWLGVMAGGAVVGALLQSVLVPVSPVFFPARVREGPLGVPSRLLTAAVVGAAWAAPVALMVAMAVDGAAWLMLVRPMGVRPLLTALVGGVLAVGITLPSLVVTCVLMTLVTLAARKDADRLMFAPQRQPVLVALGCGLPILFLAPAVAITGALLRGALQGAVGTEVP